MKTATRPKDLEPNLHLPVGLVLVPVLVFLGSIGFTAEPEVDPGGDERILSEAKVKATGPALREFFHQRTLTSTDRARAAQWLRQLGDDSFEVREKASAELLRLGRVGMPLLIRALDSTDPEVRRRAEECLSILERGTDATLVAAAARMLARQLPSETVPLLLAYLPSSPDDLVTETVVSLLEKHRFRDGKLDPVLVAALGDSEPERRAAAAQVLGKNAPELRPAIRRLLNDPDVLVRVQAALALTRHGDKTVLPHLFPLLRQAPPELVWQVEDLLFQAAGEQSPRITLAAGLDAAARRKCQEAWEQWWKERQNQVDLSRLGDERRETGSRLVCELQGGAEGGGRVFEYGPDDRVRWSFDSVAGPIDAQLLPNGRVLIAEINVNRVTERDRTGKIHFEKRLDASPMTCQRLPNGNTFIATYTELLEVAADGRTLYSFKRPQDRIYCAQKLRNGHILFVNSGGSVVELDRDGKQVRSVAAGDTSNWGSVELLPNGHFLVCRCSRHEVVEIDTTGNVVWRCEASWPTWAGRRANGRILVACAHSGQVIEFDRNSKEVWKQKLNGRPCRVRPY